MAFSGSGWIQRVAGKVRKWCDEPDTNAKFSDNDVYELIKSVYAKIFPDLAIHDRGLVVVRYDITFVTDQLEYVLPPNVGMILKVERVSTDTDRTLQEIYPTTIYAPYGMGWTVEGNILRLNQKLTWTSNNTFRIIYVPNGDMSPLEAPITVYGTDTTNKTWTIGSVVDGTLDTRPNAYGGYILRILSADTNGLVQEIPIASYDCENARVTLVRPPSPIPNGNVNAEIVPSLTKQFEDLICLGVARRMMVIDGHTTRKRLLDEEYMESLRSVRLQLAKVQQRLSSRYDGRTPENPDLPWNDGIWSYMEVY